MKALVLLLPLLAFAAAPPKLGDYLERRLAKVTRTLEQLPRDADARESLRTEEIYFSLRPHARFGVGDVARLTVQTQLDFVLTPPEPTASLATLAPPEPAASLTGTPGADSAHAPLNP